MLSFLKAWFITKVTRDEKGQDAAEYALLIGLIALGIVVAVGLLGDEIALIFTAIQAELADAVPAAVP